MRDELYDRLDAAAKGYPMKKLAVKLNKRENTLRNELTQQSGYKLELWLAILIMEITRDYSALDMIEEYFNRVAFEIPQYKDPRNPAPVMRLMGDVSKEFGENIGALSEAWKDGVINRKEIQTCLKENRDLIKKCIELEASLKTYIGEP